MDRLLHRPEKRKFLANLISNMFFRTYGGDTYGPTITESRINNLVEEIEKMMMDFALEVQARWKRDGNQDEADTIWSRTRGTISGQTLVYRVDIDKLELIPMKSRYVDTLIRHQHQVDLATTDFTQPVSYVDPFRIVGLSEKLPKKFYPARTQCEDGALEGRFRKLLETTFKTVQTSKDSSLLFQREIIAVSELELLEDSGSSKQRGYSDDQSATTASTQPIDLPICRIAMWKFNRLLGLLKEFDERCAFVASFIKYQCCTKYDGSYTAENLRRFTECEKKVVDFRYIRVTKDPKDGLLGIIVPRGRLFRIVKDQSKFKSDSINPRDAAFMGFV